MSRVYIGTYTETLPHVVGKAAGIHSATYSDGVFGPETTSIHHALSPETIDSMTSAK